MNLGQLVKTFNTIRYLKVSQLAYRAYYRLKKSKVKSVYSIALRKSIQHWHPPAYLQCATADGQAFTFLGQTSDILNNWNSDDFPKLWLYNLHYQDDLNAIGTKENTALLDQLVDRWVTYNPPLYGAGWEPYCISLRVVNWIKWFCRRPGGAAPAKWLNSLAAQVDVLSQTLEYHILANHLFANAKALTFAGVYFAGEEGDRWLSKGLALLDCELKEQFLDDGGHYELSPMYHSILLWDIADLINLARVSDIPELEQREAGWIKLFINGASWLESMVHPDEGVSFFNDSTFGIAPTLNDLKGYARFLGIGVSDVPLKKGLSGRCLKESGYCTIDWSEQSRLIIDVAKVGPDYQPGHAHADTLSCELSLFGHRVFVNSGISQYGEGEERHRQRSTSAHNTVVVDGKNSSEVWAGFRVARRAYPIDIQFIESTNCISLSAAHTGYYRLSGKVRHERSWHAELDNLVITDRLKGAYQSAVGYWHLHPGVTAELVGNSDVHLDLPSGQRVSVYISGAQLSLEPSAWHPGFGESLKNLCIVFDFQEPRVVTEIRWSMV